MDNWDIVWWCFQGLIIIIISVAVSQCSSNDRWEREAVSHGAADFVQNDKGYVQFQWKEPCEE